MLKTNLCLSSISLPNCGREMELLYAPYVTVVAQISNKAAHESYVLRGKSIVLHPKPKTHVRSACSSQSSISEVKVSYYDKFNVQKGFKKSAHIRLAPESNKKRVDTKSNSSIRTNSKLTTSSKSLIISSKSHSVITLTDNESKIKVDEITVDAQSKPKLINENCHVDCTDAKDNAGTSTERNTYLEVVELLPGVKAYSLRVMDSKSDCNSIDVDQEAVTMNTNNSTMDTQYCTNESSSDASGKEEIKWCHKLVPSQPKNQPMIPQVNMDISSKSSSGKNAKIVSAVDRHNKSLLNSVKKMEGYSLTENAQSRRINRTARHVQYLLWKENSIKSRDKSDYPYRQDFWKPSG